MNKIKDYFQEELNKYRFFSLLIFIGIITLLAWQSDDAYHAYVMAKNLVEGNGFVYNIGQRATASSCPLFTLVIAAAYFVFRNMFFASLAVCIVFSSAAYSMVVHHFCETRRQVIVTFLIAAGCTSFISYTTAGLENCQLFFLIVLFLRLFFHKEEYTRRDLLYMALLVSFIAMTRMDAVLFVAPMAVYAYLFRRKQFSFMKAFLQGVLGLLPFILWEVFALFYYGFPFPNTAYAKLGTDLARSEYLFRGLQYYLNALLCDPLVLLLPLLAIIGMFMIRKSRYVLCMSGVILYGLYVLYIGGDFMMGRHFTVMFLMSIICSLEMQNNEFSTTHRGFRFEKILMIVSFLACTYTVTMHPVTSQFQYGGSFYSPVADERAGYFKYTSLFNNVVSLATTGDMCLRDAWNEMGVDYLRDNHLPGGVLSLAPGITVYYNNDIYLTDLYALMDPFMAHLPAVKEDNWRIGHMWREAPKGYDETLACGSNLIENKDLHEYYEVIELITKGKLFDGERIRAIMDINLGKYDKLIDNYRNTLDANCRSAE